jgi:hypothetical protein
MTFKIVILGSKNGDLLGKYHHFLGKKYGFGTKISRS